VLENENKAVAENLAETPIRKYIDDLIFVLY
jgi:hypothetical protein